MINRLGAVHPAKLRAVVVTLMSAIIALSGCGDGHTSPARLEPGTIIVYDSNQLWLLDPSTAELTPYMELGEEGVSRIVKVTISPDARFIYAIVGPCKPDCDWGIEIDQPAQLIQIDTESLETHELFTYPGLSSVSLSPDGQRAVLIYSPLGFCILDISQGRCEHGELPVSMRGLYWVDNKQFVAEGVGDNGGLIVVDAETLEAKPLQVASAMGFGYIPETRQILFTQLDRSSVSFFTLDVDTLQSSRQPYTAEGYPPIDRLQISPDGRYLLYNRVASIALAEFDSGEIIAEADSVRAAAWVPNSQGLVLLRLSWVSAHTVVIHPPIQGRVIEIPLRRSHNVYTVELFDLETRQSEVLQTFDRPIGAVVVP
jgi:hypothetical protein